MYKNGVKGDKMKAINELTVEEIIKILETMDEVKAYYDSVVEYAIANDIKPDGWSVISRKSYKYGDTSKLKEWVQKNGLVNELYDLKTPAKVMDALSKMKKDDVVAELIDNEIIIQDESKPYFKKAKR